MSAVLDPERIEQLKTAMDIFIQHLRIRPSERLSRHILAPANTTAIASDYQMVIDDALQLVYSTHHRIISRLYPAAMPSVSLEQLREGPLGEDLSRLASIAMGAMRAGREEVLGAIDSVLQLLFWPVGSDTYTVPRSFWEQPLGKMLSLAKLRSFEPSDLISIGNAANMLNVTHPTIYHWMDDKVLDYVRDDMSGRTFVVKHDVEAMKADMDGELSEDITPPADESEEEQGISPNKWGTETDSEFAYLVSNVVAAAEEIIGSRRNSSMHTNTESSSVIQIILNEEPLTARNLGRLMAAFTTLHTKLWLLGQNRISDLVAYGQTRGAHFEEQASLRITHLSYNSPATAKFEVGAEDIRDAVALVTEAVPEGRGRLARLIDDLWHTDLRREAKEQELREREELLTRDREQLTQELAERRQAMRKAESDAAHEHRMQLLNEREAQLALQEKELEITKRQTEIEREKLELQRLRYEGELNRLKLASDTAMLMIERMRPDVTDPTAKAILAQELVPELLAVGGLPSFAVAISRPVLMSQTPASASDNTTESKPSISARETQQDG